MAIEYFKIKISSIYLQKLGVDMGWTNYYTNKDT